MSDDLKTEVISRRRMLSLSGLVGASALAVPPILLTVPDAVAQDKPVPGEGGKARIAPQEDKPVPGDEIRARRRKNHREWLRKRKRQPD